MGDWRRLLRHRANARVKAVIARGTLVLMQIEPSIHQFVMN